MTGVVLFHLGLALLLVTLAYMSLRFTSLDPQMPVAGSPWMNLALAVGSTLALFAIRLPLSVPWRQFFAYVAVTVVIAPAILPPYRQSKREEPNGARRFWRSQVVAKAGFWVAGLLKLGGGLIAATIIALVPGEVVPTWLLTLVAAAGFSIWTRPFSLRLPSGTIVPLERASMGLMVAINRKRWIALAATTLWLLVAMPILVGQYNQSFNIVAFAFALLVALLLT